MAYEPYDGPVIDLDQKHYHRWHLDWTTGTGIDGKPWRTLVYAPVLRPYANKMTANRHGKQFGGIQMVLQCDGGVGCPARFDPFTDPIQGRFQGAANGP